MDNLTPTRRPTDVALVLSSGGARGLAHIGAIEELEQRGYRIRSVAGCSMGALVGGIYAAGRLSDFRRWMQTIDRRKILSLMDLSLSINHIVKGERVMDALREVVPDVMIEQLSLPYVAVATDWAAGRQAVFRRGSLYDAIRASISLPLFFSPVRRDDALLIDGGVLNPIPLDLVERPQGSLLVGVNVSGPDWGGRKEVKAIAAQHPNRLRSLPMNILSRLRPEGLDVNYYTLVSRMISLMIQQNARQSIRLHRPDIVMEIPMNRFGSFDYDKSEQIVAYGRARMHQALNEWERR